ncbi:MAG: flagellar hook-basal body complex protein FliE [Desulfobacterales bacterium]|nr:flagellar hook-basal body complex protein FliE [Desulfobacterales bacterium]
MKAINVGPALRSLPNPVSSKLERPQTNQGNFENMLSGAIKQVEQDHNLANRSVEELALNKGKEIHRVMIEMEKAEISFKLLMQVRNKIVSAYETIMRMPV